MPTDWALVYRETFPDLVRYLYRKVWDAERARDLAQESFARALRSDPDQPRTWVFTIAANLARDEARLAVRRKRHLTLLKAESDAAAPAPDAALELEARERQSAVRQALELLAERDREVLLLWQAGLSYREIAERSGLATGAIGTTLARARRRLVEAYEQVEGGDVARG